MREYLEISNLFSIFVWEGGGEKSVWYARIKVLGHAALNLCPHQMEWESLNKILATVTLQHREYCPTVMPLSFNLEQYC